MSLTYWAVLLMVFLVASFASKKSHAIYEKHRIVSYRPNKRASILVGLILILVSGLRYYVGTDFPAYYFSTTSWPEVWKKIITLNEPGLWFLSWIGNSLIRDNETIIFVTAAFIIALYCATIYKYSCDFLIGVLLYIFLGDWQGSFNAIRQYMAAAVLIAGHRYILTRDLKKYLIIVFLAFLFHKTAIVMVVPYFLFINKPQGKQIVLLIIAVFVIRRSYDLIFDMVGEMKNVTMSITDFAYYSRNVSVFRVLVACSPAAVYMFACRKNPLSEEEQFYVNAILFHAFTNLASMGSAYLARVTIYSSCYLPIAFGYMLKMIQNNKSRKIIRLGAILLYFLYWYYSVHFSNLRNFHWIFERV